MSYILLLADEISSLKGGQEGRHISYLIGYVERDFLNHHAQRSINDVAAMQRLFA